MGAGPVDKFGVCVATGYACIDVNKLATQQVMYSCLNLSCPCVLLSAQSSLQRGAGSCKATKGCRILIGKKEKESKLVVLVGGITHANRMKPKPLSNQTEHERVKCVLTFVKKS